MTAIKQAEPAADAAQVIAKASRTLVVFVIVLSTPVVVGAFLTQSVFAYFWLLCHAAMVLRVSQISLELSGDGVTIRNFFSTTLIPLWEAEVEIEAGEKTILLSDSGGKLDRDGRVLYVKRTWNGGELIHVGAAPRFGAEFDRIHDDLVNGIKALRAR